MGWYDELVMVYVIGFINSRLLGFFVLLLCFRLYFVCSRLFWFCYCGYDLWYSLFYNLLYCLGCLSFFCFVVSLLWFMLLFSIRCCSPVFGINPIEFACIIMWAVRWERQGEHKANYILSINIMIIPVLFLLLKSYYIIPILYGKLSMEKAPLNSGDHQVLCSSSCEEMNLTWDLSCAPRRRWTRCAIWRHSYGRWERKVQVCNINNYIIYNMVIWWYNYNIHIYIYRVIYGDYMMIWWYMIYDYILYGVIYIYIYGHPPGTYLCSTYLLHLIFSKKDNFHFQWHKLICFISYHPKRITSNDTNSSASSDLLTQGPLPMQSFICSTPSWRKTEKKRKNQKNNNEKKRKHLDLW